jgi:RimJ/RimL family protein N-acetyltransferase
MYTLYEHKPLFIKPLYYPGPLLYSYFSKTVKRTISFRSFDLDKDLDTIHHWVNLDYALPFWQMDGSRQKVFNSYYSIQRNSNGHSYIGLMDDEPVCQFDIYRVWADEIATFTDADENACGFHLLMAPNEKPVTGLSLAVVIAFLHYYFSFPEAAIMYAEPDVLNARSNALLQKAGFSFLRPITMSYKTANLYSLTKQDFYAKNPIH